MNFMKIIIVIIAFIFSGFFVISIPLGLGMGLCHETNKCLVNTVVINYLIVLLSIILVPFSIIYGFIKDNDKYYFKFPLIAYLALFIPYVGGFILIVIALILLIISLIKIFKLKKNNIKRTVE